MYMYLYLSTFYIRYLVLVLNYNYNFYGITVSRLFDNACYIILIHQLGKWHSENSAGAKDKIFLSRLSTSTLCIQRKSKQAVCGKIIEIPLTLTCEYN